MLLMSLISNEVRANNEELNAKLASIRARVEVAIPRLPNHILNRPVGFMRQNDDTITPVYSMEPPATPLKPYKPSNKNIDMPVRNISVNASMLSKVSNTKVKHLSNDFEQDFSDTNNSSTSGK